MSTRRTVIHPAQLKDLPEGTILMDRMGLPVWNTDHAGWRSANGGRNIDLQLLIEDGAPLVILYKPDAEHHGLPGLADPTDAEVQAAASAMFDVADEQMRFPTGFDQAPEPLADTYRRMARVALLAARKVSSHE